MASTGLGRRLSTLAGYQLYREENGTTFARRSSTARWPRWLFPDKQHQQGAKQQAYRTLMQSRAAGAADILDPVLSNPSRLVPSIPRAPSQMLFQLLITVHL
jgi:hypothetical protein